MKRFLLLLSFAFCIVFFTSCQSKEPLAVYSLSGENELFSVSNGVIMLNGDKQAFSAGDLTVKGELPEIYACEMSCYLLLGEERNVLLHFRSENHTGEPLDINGDIGAVSGGSIFPKRENENTREYLDHIIFELTLFEQNGVKTVYELPMAAKIVFEQ